MLTQHPHGAPSQAPSLSARAPSRQAVQSGHISQQLASLIDQQAHSLQLQQSQRNKKKAQDVCSCIYYPQEPF